MKSDENLSQIFDITPTSEQEIVSKAGEVIVHSDRKIEDDYDHTRNNLREIITKGHDALEHALSIAKQSEHPRAFEVVGNLVKQLADVNQQLLDIHKQKQKLDEPSKADQSKNVTNNNAIFVGSTAELNKLIKNMTKGE